MNTLVEEYRNTTTGIALIESLEIMIQEGDIDEQTAHIILVSDFCDLFSWIIYSS